MTEREHPTHAPDVEVLAARANLRAMMTASIAGPFEELLGRPMTRDERMAILGPGNIRLVAALNVLDELAHVDYVRKLRLELQVDPALDDAVVVVGTMASCITAAPHAHAPRIEIEASVTPITGLDGQSIGKVHIHRGTTPPPPSDLSN